MDSIVAPSLFSADMLHLEEELRSIEQSGAKWVHLDVMDGTFVPNFFLSPKTIQDIRRGTNLFLDTHLMIIHPEKHIETFACSGSDSITVHYEACQNPLATVMKIKTVGCNAGIAISPDTPIKYIFPLLRHLDMVLVMSIYPGKSGQIFQNTAIRRIQTIAQERQRLGLSFMISVDGGVNPSNAVRCIKAGANILVTGSSFFSRQDRSVFVQSMLDLK